MIDTITVLSENDEHTREGFLRDDVIWVKESLVNEWGWQWKDRGLCREDECIPVPGDGSLVSEGFVNLSSFADRIGRPLAFEPDPPVASIGSSHDNLRKTLDAGQAPDFELPGWQGTSHRLSDFEGKKIFLLVWASW